MWETRRGSADGVMKWILFLLLNAVYPTMDHDLLGLFALAALLGARHGFDADHLAAIDAMTRLEMRRRPATARQSLAPR